MGEKKKKYYEAKIISEADAPKTFKKEGFFLKYKSRLKWNHKYVYSYIKKKNYIPVAQGQA